MSRTVIKAGDARLGSRGVFSLDLRDIGRDAAAMLEAARVEAARIVAEANAAARVQSELIRQTAHHEGHEQGLARGKETGHAEALEEARARFTTDHASLAGALTSALTAFSAKRERLYLEARRDVVVLAIAIASRVFKRMSSDDGAASAAATQALQESLAMIATVTEAKVRAHPDDVEALERFTSDVAGAASAGQSVRIVADEAIARGGVMVESSDSTVDAAIVSRLERIADELVTDWRGRMEKLGLTTESAETPAG